MVSNRQIIQVILADDVLGVDALLKIDTQLDLNAVISDEGFYLNRYRRMSGKPLFIALDHGCFAVARHILSHFQKLILNSGDITNEMLISYYTQDGMDPLSVTEDFIKNNQDASKAEAFIDELYDLLPPQFIQLNPAIFKIGDHAVDIFAKMLLRQPKQLTALLKGNLLPVLDFQLCLKNLLFLAVAKGYKGLFDLIQEKLPLHVDISLYRYSNGNTLIHTCIPTGNLHILFDLLKLDKNKGMLGEKNSKGQTPADLALMTNNTSAFVLLKLFEMNCDLHGLLQQVATEKNTASVPASAGLFLFLTPSKINTWQLLLDKLGDQDNFFNKFFLNADFSKIDSECQNKEMVQFVFNKISQVQFSYANQKQIKTTTLHDLLGGDIFNSDWRALSKEVLIKWQNEPNLPSIKI